MRRNHEPGTATTKIASSRPRSPTKRHGIHAKIKKLLIKKMNFAGSCVCKKKKNIFFIIIIIKMNR